MVAMRYITNTCPVCGGTYEFSEQDVGREWKCPHCGEPVQLRQATSPRASASILWGIVALVVVGIVLSGTALFIYFDSRREARERERHRAEQEQARTDALLKQNRTNQASAAEKASAQAASTEALLRSLRQEIDELRNTNAILTSNFARGRPAPQAPVQSTPTWPQPSLQRFQVHEILANYGYLKCRTDRGEVLIQDLPSQVGTFLAELAKRKAEVAAYSRKVEAYDQAARRADAVAPGGLGGDPAYVDAGMRQRAEANLMAEDVRDGKANLTKMEANLSEWERVEEARTTILAQRTEKQYGGMQIWRFVAMASSPPPRR